jgi:hypothetical protein
MQPSRSGICPAITGKPAPTLAMASLAGADRAIDFDKGRLNIHTAEFNLCVRTRAV